MRTVVYLAPDANWEEASQAHREALGDVGPASTMLYVAGLIGEGLPRRGGGNGGGGRMRFSVRVNNDLSVAELSALTVAAEAAGFDQVWVSNDLLLRSAPVLAATLAARTSRISLGIGVMNPYSVHPSELAMMAATLQEASGGRFLLGIGAGAEEFLAWAGIARTAPLATTRAAVVTLRALLGHTDVDRSLLPAWAREHVAALKFPLGRPVPVYVGAMGPKMLTMAGQHADGALPLLYPPETYAAARASVLSGAAPAGRDVDLPACFWVSLSDDPAQARAALAEKLAYYGASFAEPLLEQAGLRPPTSPRRRGSRTAGRRPPRSSTTGCCRSASPATPAT